MEYVHHCQIGEFYLHWARDSARIAQKKNFNVIDQNISLQQYFVDYKLSEAYTGVNSEYDTFFMSYLGFAAQIPNVVFNWMNIFVNLGWVNNLDCLHVIEWKLNGKQLFLFDAQLPQRECHTTHRLEYHYRGFGFHCDSRIGNDRFITMAGLFLLVHNGNRRYFKRWVSSNRMSFILQLANGIIVLNDEIWNFSCRWNLSEFSVRNGRQIAIQIHWSSCVRLQY